MGTIDMGITEGPSALTRERTWCVPHHVPDMGSLTVGTIKSLEKAQDASLLNGCVRMGLGCGMGVNIPSSDRM
jgi:hypothetical protein